MRLSPVETQVFDAIKDLEAIDAHKHLVSRDTSQVDLGYRTSVEFEVESRGKMLLN